MDVARENLPGRGIGRDLRTSEKMEGDLDNFIIKRHNVRVASEGERRELEAWQEFERRHQEKRRQLARIEWHAHHLDQASRLRRTLEQLIEHHEQQAARLLAGGT